MAGVALGPREICRELLASMGDLGPALLVIDVRGGDLGAVRAAVQALACARVPLLRWTVLGWPRCGPTDLQPDLWLLEAGPATAAACQGCAHAGVCPGPPVDHLPRSEAGAVSNQFDLVPVSGSGLIRAELEDRETAWQVDGDVDAAEVALALTRGQIYQDLSSAARLGDFAAQLRLLSPAADGVWRPAAGQPFAAEEAQLRQILRQLRGVIVDVGAGPVRYVGELRPAIAADLVRYLAVEPDPEHLAHSAAALPEGRFVRGVGEALPLGSGSVDAVLWLRSWNHLRDPAAAVREALRVARPGGQLIAVDNVVFGLLRTPEQLQLARSLPLEVTPFEHWRNDCAARALALWQEVGGRRLELESCADVAIGTSNQWLLTARVLE